MSQTSDKKKEITAQRIALKSVRENLDTSNARWHIRTSPPRLESFQKVICVLSTTMMAKNGKRSLSAKQTPMGAKLRSETNRQASLSTITWHTQRSITLHRLQNLASKVFWSNLRQQGSLLRLSFRGPKCRPLRIVPSKQATTRWAPRQITGG